MDLRQQLSDIIYDSGMTTQDFAIAMGISYNSLKRMLMGKWPINHGHINDAVQIQNDLIDFEQIVDQNPLLKNISYTVCKTILAQYQKDVDTEENL